MMFYTKRIKVTGTNFERVNVGFSRSVKFGGRHGYEVEFKESVQHDVNFKTEGSKPYVDLWIIRWNYYGRCKLWLQRDRGTDKTKYIN
jgi:hypothetical protein